MPIPHKDVRAKRFLDKATVKYPDLDFSMMEYEHSKKPIKVVCPIHGEFEQTPEHFIMGHGCKICGRKIAIDKLSLTQEEFIKRCEEHFPEYDYSQTIYSGVKTKVSIICPIHGKVIKHPNALMRGQGCGKCGNIDRGKIQIEKCADEFIEKAAAIHGDKYDYSQVIYTGNKNPVNIICPTHGIFQQKPIGHLSGSGCNSCGKELMGQTLRSNINEFIRKALLVHEHKYIYNDAVYINNEHKIEITCEKHGSFWQKPSGHLSGQGCPLCKPKETYTRTGWREMCNGRSSYVYLILITTPLETCLKIGITTNLKKRFQGIKQHDIIVEQLAIMCFENPDDTYNMEKILFKALEEYRLKTQHWFAGHTECLLNVSEVLSTFNLLSPKG